MHRRQPLAAAGAGVAVVLSGCLGDALAGGPPEYDCADADRPEPPAPSDDAGDAVEPSPYPDRPESLSGTAAVGYVEAYERVYRRNALVERHGGQLRSWGMGVEESETRDAPEGAAVVGIGYTYYAQYDHGEGEVHADSPTIYVTYYVDDEVVIRAERDEPAGAGDPYPDPRTVGTPLECFD